MLTSGTSRTCASGARLLSSGVPDPQCSALQDPQLILDTTRRAVMGEPHFTQKHVDVVAEAAFRDMSPAGVLERIPEEVDWVLIGESTHGTHEFLDMRSELTKLLIERRGFNAIGSEAGDLVLHAVGPSLHVLSLK